MGREDPIEFDNFPIYSLFVFIYIEWEWIVLLGWWEEYYLTPLCFYIFMYIFLIHLFWL